MFERFPIYRQLDTMDCGPTCLQMICAFHGISASINQLRQLTNKGNQGTSLLSLKNAAKELGLRVRAFKFPLEQLIKNQQLPAIVPFNNNHFAIVYKATNKKLYVADPAVGKIVMTYAEFQNYWSQGEHTGKALIFEKLPQNITPSIEANQHQPPNGLKTLFQYFLTYKSLVYQMILGASIILLFSLILPFLTQILIDNGVGNGDLNFIYVILAAQTLLFLSKTVAEFIQGWIVAHIGSRVNYLVVADYLSKLLNLPLSFFDRRNLGDVLQRVLDHRKIEEFLTSQSIMILFSILNIIIFSIVMSIYSLLIFGVFLAASLFSIGWATLFLNRRKILDYDWFNESTRNHSSIVQMVDGMVETKLNGAEETRKHTWEEIQNRLFQLRLKKLSIDQYQTGGTMFINEAKNITITFIASIMVVEGQLTIGMLVAIIFMLGQLNAPMEQIIGFITKAQDAKLSMERLLDVHSSPDEDENIPHGMLAIESKDINLENISFSYDKQAAKNVFADLSLHIPQNKVTAIVGTSGSGKTTLLKLLLKIHKPDQGNINIGDRPLSSIKAQDWRKKCACVLQDGYIFSDTILVNIAMDDADINYERVLHAAKMANIHDFIQQLPNGFSTKIGNEGQSLSGGQQQRILIARAIYQNPQYLFLDEATSALDATNEKVIRDNLDYFFKGRTVVIVAHRLSTVKHADKIIVLDKGKVVETGNHDELSRSKGMYFQLVKDQLELGV
jgi:ATP-binding cassette subfamily B protein